MVFPGADSGDVRIFGFFDPAYDENFSHNNRVRNNFVDHLRGEISLQLVGFLILAR